MHLNITIYTDDSIGATRLDTVITLTGGIKGTTERRVMDWTVQDHKDYIFSACQHRSRFVYSSKDENTDGEVYPDFEMQTDVSDEKVKMFLRGEVDEDGKKSSWSMPGSAEKDGGRVWMHTFMRNLDAGWTMEQMWGFEEINGQLYHTKRVVAAGAKGQYTLSRQVLRKE
ncbi:hypothetical protein BDV12DRAFT_200179 [Aspergillus spectabilis]